YAESRSHQWLRFTAGEQRRTVGARQNPGLDRDGPDGAGVASVDARLAFENAVANDAALQAEQLIVDGIGLPLRVLDAGECGDSGRLDLSNTSVALLLFGDLVGLRQRPFSVRSHCILQLR